MNVALTCLVLSCFESTYKELKLSQSRRFTATCPSFESTYKELKYVFNPSGDNAGECFESTYKELKYACINIILLWHS